MAPGERAAIEGLLAQMRPALAVEIGTAQGGSLRRIAAHSGEVHTFDLVPDVDQSAFPNVTFHCGDSHILLKKLLRELEEQGRNVDFALIDGDHRGGGVRQDLEDLLGSGCARQTCIVMHDTMNEGVRDGLAGLDFTAFPDVAYVDLSFVQLDQSTSGLGERWGGLGLVLVDASRSSGCRTGVVVRREGLTRQLIEIAWLLASPVRAILRRIYHRFKGAGLPRRSGPRTSSDQR